MAASFRGKRDETAQESQEFNSSRPVFVVTGFGKFAGVPENPTTKLVIDLRKKYPNLLTKILETSMVGVRQGLDAIDSELQAQGIDPSDVIWIHMGVYGGSPGFRLEHKSYNEATFRVPDERGEKPNKEEIIPGGQPFLSCGFDLASLCSELRKALEGTVNINVTDDPGRFVCNYVYYSSLSRHGANVLFVHVPDFSTVNLSSQMAVIERILEMIPNYRLSEIYRQNPKDATLFLALGQDASEDEKRDWIQSHPQVSPISSYEELIELQTTKAI
mmetsp:Transcript_16333/g.31712  ORF Transcript_16333/g.31712 Transcript_16333/m.31712 type:complete len:274 (-) Transcript_16333:380-1201(-)|eukprot:CAMPEP_0171488062 /NCGR_PEP_ID=MMETSP0958-20121227/1997_1 /TAXON_ID=87120 /ORGANISM="Aurantiochytrium limacinum, Strain ATCCMYA-1381" /LENGTH=273 /DNA_ID=CAMNT_0012021131 /DNA_START=60 /DNA_END=881 /DNA_ORIENTATION=+